jgi:single-strand DNA-binding protein
MNKTLLIGRLTKDPEMQDVGSNKICKFGLAVNRRFKKEGQEADFFNIIA